MLAGKALLLGMQTFLRLDTAAPWWQGCVQVVATRKIYVSQKSTAKDDDSQAFAAKIGSALDFGNSFQMKRHIGEIGQNSNFSRLLTDVRVVITNANEITEGAEEKYELAWCDKLNYEIFSLFTTRYRLHKSVYTHHAVKSHEYIIIDILKSFHDLLLKGKIDFIDLTDSVVFCKLCALKSPATKRLMSRDIPTFIGEVVVPKNYENKKLMPWVFPKIIGNIIIDKIQIKFSSGNYNPMNEIYYYNSSNNHGKKMKPTWCNVEFNETILRCYDNAGKKNTGESKHFEKKNIQEFWEKYLKELELL